MNFAQILCLLTAGPLCENIFTSLMILCMLGFQGNAEPNCARAQSAEIFVCGKQLAAVESVKPLSMASLDITRSRTNSLHVHFTHSCTIFLLYGMKTRMPK